MFVAVACVYVSYSPCFAFILAIIVALGAGGRCVDFVVVVDGNNVMKPTAIEFSSVDKIR